MIEIIRMELTHAQDAAVIEQKCFSMPWSIAMFEEELEQDYTVYLSAVENSRLIGYAGMHLMFEEAYITNVAVLPENRRQGIATKLLQRLMYEAKNAGALRISLEVRQTNLAAATLYGKLGFTPCGVRKGYYSQPEEDAVIMCAELHIKEYHFK
jgi:ribosomal-protein-alanine N-acetyltransferase